MNDRWQSLMALVPRASQTAEDWQAIQAHPLLSSALHSMAQTMQNPAWHGEGDVLTHTRMVCQALTMLPAWQRCSRPRQEALFLAALLHDVGKPICTHWEQGALVSPHHAGVGEKIARTLLWRDFGISGTPEAQRLRETVCTLIRFHTAPLHTVYAADPIRKLAFMAASLAEDFDLYMLYLLATADVTGRIASDQALSLERIEFFRDIATEAGCLHGALPFPTAYSRYAYLAGRAIQPGQELYDDTWGPVIMLSGLPGTGKDTYCALQHNGLPVVSLDAFRKSLHIKPTDEQGSVVQAAKNQAMEYLRKRQPFVWNATDLTLRMRAKQLELFGRYGASTHLVYLETGWEELLRRNENRAEKVPEAVLERLLEGLEPPTLREARTVAWACT